MGETRERGIRACVFGEKPINFPFQCECIGRNVYETNTFRAFTSLYSSRRAPSIAMIAWRFRVFKHTAKKVHRSARAPVNNSSLHVSYPASSRRGKNVWTESTANGKDLTLKHRKSGNRTKRNEGKKAAKRTRRERAARKMRFFLGSFQFLLACFWELCSRRYVLKIWLYCTLCWKIIKVFVLQYVGI